MSSKMTLPAQKRSKLFTIGVICLSVAILIVLLATFIPRIAGNATGGVNKGAKSNITNGFECNVKANYDGGNYELKLNKAKDSGYVMTFVKPDTLANLSFEATADGLKVKRNALEIVVDPTSIPQKSVYDAVIGVFDSCLSKNLTTSTADKDTVVSGKSAAGDFTITFDSDNRPKSLSIPSLKFSAEITDFKTL